MGATDAQGWYVPASKMGLPCVGATCVFSLTAGLNGDPDADQCLEAKPLCDKMYGGDKTKACAFSATAGKDKYLLKWVANAGTTVKCAKGTCKTGPIETADQGRCCEPNPRKCDDLFDGTPVAATQCAGFGGTYAADYGDLYVPLAAQSATNWATLGSLGPDVLKAARNRCCSGG